MIDADSAPEFDAAMWLANWLAAPLPALGGQSPGSFMDPLQPDAARIVATVLRKWYYDPRFSRRGGGASLQ